MKFLTAGVWSLVFAACLGELRAGETPASPRVARCATKSVVRATTANPHTTAPLPATCCNPTPAVFVRGSTPLVRWLLTGEPIASTDEEPANPAPLANSAKSGTQSSGEECVNDSERTAAWIDEWTRASTTSEPITDAERRRITGAWRRRLNGHEIDLLVALHGPVNRELVKRFDWTSRAKAGDAPVLRAEPRDPLEKRFVPRIEVTLDPSTGRPASVRFLDRPGGAEDRIVAIAPRVPEILDVATVVASADGVDSDEPARDAGAIRTVAGDAPAGRRPTVQRAVAESPPAPPRRLNVESAAAINSEAQHVLTAWQRASAHVRDFAARYRIDGPDPFATSETQVTGELTCGVLADSNLPGDAPWVREWLLPIHAPTLLRRFDVRINSDDDESISVMLVPRDGDGRARREVIEIDLSSRTMLPTRLARHDVVQGTRVVLTLTETRINLPFAAAAASQSAATRAPNRNQVRTASAVSDATAPGERRPVPPPGSPRDDRGDGPLRRPNPPLDSRRILDE